MGDDSIYHHKRQMGVVEFKVAFIAVAQNSKFNIHEQRNRRARSCGCFLAQSMVPLVDDAK